MSALRSSAFFFSSARNSSGVFDMQIMLSVNFILYRNSFFFFSSLLVAGPTIFRRKCTSFIAILGGSAQKYRHIFSLPYYLPKKKKKIEKKNLIKLDINRCTLNFIAVPYFRVVFGEVSFFFFGRRFKLIKLDLVGSNATRRMNSEPEDVSSV